MNMPSAEQQFDDAMHHFSRADFNGAIAKLQGLLTEAPDHLDGRLALGMAYYRKGDYQAAIAEGHKAEHSHPREPLVHTNLSLFYVKVGDKQKAEHHALQARIASWREGSPAPGQPAGPTAELPVAKPSPVPAKFSGKLPDMPWKKTASAPEKQPPKTAETDPDKPSSA